MELEELIEAEVEAEAEAEAEAKVGVREEQWRERVQFALCSFYGQFDS